MTRRKRIALFIIALLLALTLVGCEEEYDNGYCFNSWTGKMYWCGD